MSNSIKGPGGPSGPGPIDATTSTQATEATPQAGFDTVLAGQQAGAADGAAAADPAVEAIVTGVAEDLRAGRLSDPEAAIEAVIDQIVELRFGHIQPNVRERMGEDLRTALMDDPFFVLEVEELIGHALDPG